MHRHLKSVDSLSQEPSFSVLATFPKMGKRAHREVVAGNAATGAASATSGAAGAGTGTEAANGTDAANGAELPAKLLPQSWSELIALRGAPPCTADEYLCSLAPSVRERLVAFLSQGQQDGGILLQGALEDQQPLQIDSKKNHGNLQSFKEHWRWSQCQHSLAEHGLYEAPGNGFWLNVERAIWKEESLPATGLTFKNIDGGRMMWSDAKFERSGDNERNRHYFLSIAIPTAVANASDVNDAAAAAADGAGKKGLGRLPCLASRACLAGWYSQMDDALRANNVLKIKKLFQAMLSLPMRLRVAPDETQIALDSITYSEDLHVARSASSDAFFDFAEKSCPLLKKAIVVNPYQAAAAVAKEGQKLGITYHGAPLERNMARALLEVAPYVGNDDVRSALKELENISSVLSDQSKCAGLFGMVTKHFGKGSIAAVGAVVEAVSAIRIAIMYQDVPSERAMTKDFLFGGSKTKKVLIFGCGQMRAATIRLQSMSSERLFAPRGCAVLPTATGHHPFPPSPSPFHHFRQGRLFSLHPSVILVSSVFLAQCLSSCV
jgi:hypothetical protein